MKTRFILLTIVAVLVVLFPLIPLLQFHFGNQVMMNNMTVSGSTVWLISIVFSTFSWFLFAWASKSIKVVGIPLSIISSAVLMIPFYGVLGPMASVIVGVVAGFVAFIFHKYMIIRDNKSLIITIATVAVSYLALTMLIVLVSNTLHIWDTGDGIGEWTGTAEGMERHVQIVGPSFIVDNMPTGNPNECWYQDENGEMAPCLVHMDTLDLDPDLSPSYALDISGNFLYYILLSFVGIASLFLVPYFILKTKNIPSRPYMALILSGLLLHYGITTLIGSVPQLSLVLFALEKGESFIFITLVISFLIPIIVCVISGIILYKSPVIRKLIKK